MWVKITLIAVTWVSFKTFPGKEIIITKSLTMCLKVLQLGRRVPWLVLLLPLPSSWIHPHGENHCCGDVLWDGESSSDHHDDCDVHMLMLVARCGGAGAVCQETCPPASPPSWDSMSPTTQTRYSATNLWYAMVSYQIIPGQHEPGEGCCMLGGAPGDLSGQVTGAVASLALPHLLYKYNLM